MILTWLLWRRLRTFPQLTIPWNQQASQKPKPPPWLQWLIGITIAIGMVIWLIQTPLAFLAILWVVLALPFGFLFLNGILYGLYWSVQVSTAIARERERGSFAMMSLTPEGAMGASWLWVRTILNQENTLHKLHIMVRAVVIVALLTLLLAAVSVYISAQSSPATRAASYGGLASLILMAFLVIALFFEHMQSIVMGSLVGMLIPAWLPSVFDARIWSVGIYLLLQFGFYAVMALMITLLSAFFRTLPPGNHLADITHGVLLLLIFVATREGIIRTLWHYLSYQLNADTHAINSMKSRS